MLDVVKNISCKYILRFTLPTMMTDLSVISGLPLSIDTDTGEIVLNESLKYDAERKVRIADIAPVLLNKFIKYPENVYSMLSNVCLKDDTDVMSTTYLTFDLIQLPFGLLGIEYIKTHIYYSDFVKKKYDCVVQLFSGKIAVVMQKNKQSDEEYNEEYSFSTEVEKVEIVDLEPGDRLMIPSGVYYTFVNTGMEKSVFAMICSKAHKEIDYARLNKEKGLAFYIISKNGKIEIVANPKYRCERNPKHMTLKTMDDKNKKQFEGGLLEKAQDALYSLFRDNNEELEDLLVN